MGVMQEGGWEGAGREMEGRTRPSIRYSTSLSSQHRKGKGRVAAEEAGGQPRDGLT